jgi:hypothetical protein
MTNHKIGSTKKKVIDNLSVLAVIVVLLTRSYRLSSL